MIVRLRYWYEKVRSSLFWTPAAYVMGAVVLAFVTIRVQSTGVPDIPIILVATSDAASTVLQTIAAATITVAGLVFPVMVVALQLASSQFSPRVLRGFLRDRTFQHVLGFVVATFTFCVLGLATGPVASGSLEEPVRNLPITVATILAVGSVLAIVAFIHHSARYMQVVEIIRRTTMETRERINELFPHAAGEQPTLDLPDDPVPDTPPHRIRARHDGWVQQLDVHVLLEALPDDAMARVDVRAGVFVVQDQTLLTVWLPPGADSRQLDGVEDELRDAFAIGSNRTMQHDVGFGIRQIVDIALRALSPAINDPTTASEVTVNLGAILRDLLVRDLPWKVRSDDRNRTVLRPHELSHADYVDEAFDQLRLAAAPHPVAAINVIATIATLVHLLRERGLESRTTPLLRQIELTVDAVEAHHPHAHDLEKVRRAAAELQEMPTATALSGKG